MGMASRHDVWRETKKLRITPIPRDLCRYSSIPPSLTVTNSNVEASVAREKVLVVIVES